MIFPDLHLTPKPLFVPNKLIRDYFDFSRRERTGIACLLVLIALIYSLPYGWGYLHESRIRSDTAGFREAALAVEAMMLTDSIARSKRKQYEGHGPRYRQYAPGKYSSASPRYEKGAYGRNRDYGGRWYPYDSGRYRKKEYYPGNRGQASWRDRPYQFRDSSQRRPLKVDINAADSAQWERLPLIGPVLAQRIVRFRERLGGFHEVAQVGETYGLADSVFKKIQGMLMLGEVSLRKTNLNQTDEKSLADHPYINTKLARLIVRYRSNHGPFRHPGELRGIALVNDSIYRKLEKYLEVK